MSTSVITFSSSSSPVVPGTPSLVYNLPATLDPGFTKTVSTSVIGVGVTASISVQGGLTGGIDLTLGQYALKYPVSINPGLPTGKVTDGKTFTVDPTLIGTNDASFSLLGPGASASLSLGLTAKGSLTIDSHAVANVNGNWSTSLPTSHTFNPISGLTITIAEPMSFQAQSNTATAALSLPSLNASGTDNASLQATADLVNLVADLDPAVASVIDGNYSVHTPVFSATAFSASWSLFSAPLKGSIAAGSSLTITPTGITEVVKEMDGATQIGATQTGALGTTFTFTAPSSGSGDVQIDVAYTLNFQVTNKLGIDASLSLGLDGPQGKIDVLGVTASFGPLFSTTLFSLNSGLVPFNTSVTNANLTKSAAYSLAFGSSGPIDWANPGAGGDFGTGGNWTSSAVPGGADVVLGASATPYTVTSTANESETSLTLGANATLDINGGIFGVAGAIDNGGTIQVDKGAALAAAAAAVALSGGGTLAMNGGDLERSAVGATLTNVDNTISGSGYIGLGGLRLANDAAGVIESTGGFLVLKSPKAVVNGGLIEADSSTLEIISTTINSSSGGTVEVDSRLDLRGGTLDGGSLIIANGGQLLAIGAGSDLINLGGGVVTNNGRLRALSSLTIDGAVTGSGWAAVGNATLTVEGTFGQNVYFTPLSTGVLALANSEDYTGVITGFSHSGSSTLDLQDINSATASWTYNGTTTSGVLTVTDGTHTANIKLSGDYLGSTFVLSPDLGTGTLVVDPHKKDASHAPQVAAAASHSPAASASHFVAAAASFTAAPVSAIAASTRSWRVEVSQVALPRGAYG